LPCKHTPRPQPLPSRRHPQAAGLTHDSRVDAVKPSRSAARDAAAAGGVALGPVRAQGPTWLRLLLLLLLMAGLLFQDPHPPIQQVFIFGSVPCCSLLLLVMGWLLVIPGLPPRLLLLLPLVLPLGHGPRRRVSIHVTSSASGAQLLLLLVGRWAPAGCCLCSNHGVHQPRHAHKRRGP
jgi:hypothetical protein